VIETPLKVSLSSSDPHLLTTGGVLYQPICLTISVENRGDSVIDSEISIDEVDDFYISGELRTYLPLMPGETYSFHYNVIPLQIGRLSLPKFNIAETADGGDTKDKIFHIKGFTKKVLILK
jgi:hypothetical protein